MKLKILKTFSIGVLVALCVVGGSSIQTVKAASLLDAREEMTEDETDADYSEDRNTPRTRSNYLNFGSVRINKLSENQCAVFGTTEAYNYFDMLYLDLTLEQKNNGSYSTYKTWSYNAPNELGLSKGFNVIVPKNHYYRLKGYHAVKEGTVKESTTTQTKGVWIGD